MFIRFGRAAVIACAISFAGPAWSASEAVLCVQEELAQLGYNPGQIDGELSGMTRGASEAYRAEMQRRDPNWAKPALKADNADFWCEKVAGAFPEVASHYRKFLGEEEGDQPAFDPKFSVEAARREFLFDKDYYLAQLPDPSLAKTNAYSHFLQKGWKEGYDPSALFDTSAYLEANPDVAGLGINPLTHYIQKGMAEYRGFGGRSDESGFIFDVGKSVPEKQVAEIKEGLAIAQAYLEKEFGGAIPADVAAKVIVKVEATGKGNQERGAGNGVATGLSSQNDLLPRPYFDVANKDWNQNAKSRGWTTATDNIKTVVHEYTHGWQAYLGVMSMYQQPLGNWMNEGIAEYIAYNAMVDADRMSLKSANAFVASAARGPELDNPLEAFGTTESPAWAGHVGYLAIDWLVAESPNGRRSIRIIADELKAGKSVAKTFRSAFGLELTSFYEQFEPYREALRKNAEKAMANRPRLALADGVMGPIPSEALAKCIQSGLNAASHPVGGVDGVIGNGTEKAFDAYVKASNLSGSVLALREDNYKVICLWLARHNDLGSQYEAVAEQLLEATEARINIQIPEDAKFVVQFLRGEQVIADVEDFKWTPFAGGYAHRATRPLADLTAADTMCIRLRDGWVVKDQAGKLYQGSCDAVEPTFYALPALSHVYSVEKMAQ